LHDVPRHGVNIIVRPQNSIEVPGLPEPAVNPVPRDVRRSLLCHAHECTKIRRFRLAFCEDVEVVWHEAVRIYCELLLAGSTKECRPDIVNESFGRKAPPSFERADCEEILVTALVGESRETSWPHVIEEQNPVPAAHKGPPYL